jgi:peptidoglycan hydrolase-like protein with peptidoglycan-binding domain
MKAKGFITSAAAAALALASATEVAANDGIVGGVIGGVISGIIMNEANRSRTPQRTAPQRSPQVSSAQRDQNRQVQTALNHFGYNAGTVDGIVGRGTRAAIGQFEAEMGFFADQNLDDAERGFLLSSYQRAISGNIGPHGQAMATGGPRGLLRSFNDERMGRFAGFQGGNTPGAIQPSHMGQPGTTQTGFGQPGFPQPGFPQPGVVPGQMPPTAVAPQAGQAQVQVPQTVVTPAPVPAAPLAGGLAALPTITFTPQQASMAQYCSETAQMTAVNGGPQGITGLTNAGQALGEQFCMAREFSVARGDQRVAAVQGMTSADIRATCDQVAAALAPATGSVAGGAPEAAITAAKAVAGGMSTVDMVNLGEICLGIGYTDDKPALSLASALLLVAADKVPYAEIVGHHLQAGFGTAANPAAASGWFALALAAADQGMPAEILPAQAERRNAVIRAALGSPIQASNGLGGALPTLVVSPAP